MTTVHRLKTWPVYWRAVADGRKAFEVRENVGRDFVIGDILELVEWDPVSELEGRTLMVEVTYVCSLPGVPGYVGMGIRPYA